MLVISPAVGCHYYLPVSWLPSQLQRIIAFGQYKFVLLGKQRLMTCLGRRATEQLA